MDLGTQVSPQQAALTSLFPKVDPHGLVTLFCSCVPHPRTWSSGVLALVGALRTGRGVSWLPSGVGAPPPSLPFLSSCRASAPLC